MLFLSLEGCTNCIVLNEKNVCFVGLGKAFDRIPRKVLEWTMRKKAIPEVLARSVMSLYELAKRRIIVDSELPDDVEVKVGMLIGSVLSTFLFTVVADVVTKLARDGVLSELLYADDLELMSEIIKGLRNEFIKWKEILIARV